MVSPFYIQRLKKQTVDTLYERLQTYVWLADWYINGKKKKIGKYGHIYETDEYIESHSIKNGIESLAIINAILNELRIRREIE